MIVRPVVARTPSALDDRGADIGDVRSLWGFALSVSPGVSRARSVERARRAPTRIIRS